MPQSWGSKKMDEFIAWVSQPGKPSDTPSQPVNPTIARQHINNILEYISRLEKLAKLGNKDAADLFSAISPVRPLLSSAKTGTQIAEAAQVSSSYLQSYTEHLRQQAEDKVASRDDQSMTAADDRTIADASVEGLYQKNAFRAISYNTSDGSSIPQLLACKVQRDFIHKLMFWEKTHDVAYAPCASILYLLKLSKG